MVTNKIWTNYMDVTYFGFNKHFLSYPFAKKQKIALKCLSTYWFKNIFIKKLHISVLYILSLHIVSIYWHLI